MRDRFVKSGLTAALAAAGVLALVAAPALAAPRRSQPQAAPLLPELPANTDILRLENGLPVVLLRNPGQPMVGIYTQVLVGSAREDFRTSGMSHMLEHLLFNGTEKYTQEELYQAADAVGAYNNANTTDFYTNYMMVVPAEHLEKGMDLQSQMLFHSLVPAEKFAKEQGIVVGEIVQGRDRPGEFAENTLREVIFAGSDLELPTVGTMATIEHMNRDDVYEFYRRWYVPNNMILTVAGNFDRAQVLEWLEKYYGGVPPGTLVRPDQRPARPIETTRGVTRRGGDSRALALVFTAPTWGQDDHTAFLVLNELLTLEGSGIITRALGAMDEAVRPEVSSWWEASPGYGRLVLRFELQEGTDAETLLPLVQRAVADAADGGIDETAIRGIARLNATQTLLNREQLRMTGIYIADALVQGGPDAFVGYLDRLNAVTAEDVSRVLDRWLAGAPCLAVLIEPAAPAAPAPQGRTAGMPGGAPAGMGGSGHAAAMPPSMPPSMPPAAAGSGAPAGMPGRMPAAAPEAPKEPAAPAVPAAPAAPEVERTVLPTGAVVVSQTNPASPLTAIHLTVRARSRLDRELAAAGAVDLAHRLLDEGFAGCNGECLAARLRELGALVKKVDDPGIPMDDYYTSGRYSFIRVECAAGNGREVLALLAEALRSAAFDEADFTRLRGQRMADLGRQQGSARVVADALLDRELFGDHALTMPPEGDAQSIGGLSYRQVREVFGEAFAPRNLIIACVGPQSHAQWCADVIALLPGRGVPTAALPPLPVTAAAGAAKATVGGQLTAIRLGSVFNVDQGDERALGLLVSILSDRLAMELRETRGLSYSVGASVELEAGQATLTAWLNPPSNRGEEGRTALREFIEGFDPATITADEVTRTHAARRGRLMMRRLSSLGQAYYLAMAELDGDLAAYARGLAGGEPPALTDLQAAAVKYLAGRPWVEVVVD
ncbi:MAG: insulinase family protein [bacterium]|nr:insulinase family protein [bacterium]